MWNLKKMTQMNIATEQKDSEQTCSYEVGGEREGLGVWDQQIQTITCRVDKQQGRSNCIAQGTIFNIL